MPVFGSVEPSPFIRPIPVEPALKPVEITLADSTVATVFPLYSSDLIPLTLLAHMCDEFNDEIVRGQTYPIENPLTIEQFKQYWCGDFTAIALAGSLAEFEELSAKAHPVNTAAAADPLQQQLHESPEPSAVVKLIPVAADWSKIFLGTFHVLPNYPDRCAHVCNAGFLISTGSRGKRIGSELGKVYLQWAPQLGYTYSVFNLVFETNTASLKIWESLGFERIGKVKGAAKLKGIDEPVAAIIIGKDLV
ncbi:hypothetical protein D0Z00_001826 [Geotrichum galactomycetum]|uniref:Uncharacterized protein n=1 Tax=Geotrichum galactomycetum TaxID=27317 RepID=A0ACB6V5T2_9ASCO|nr:hypothetical protein D0Z00_001826 [Geotrichum candidum]